MIEIQNLVVSLDGKTVIGGISCMIPSNAITVLLGKNGSGKTVLLKTMAGLVRYDTGSIRVESNGSRPESARAGYRIAYVFQKGGLFDSMTVFDNVAFGLRREGRDEDYIRERVALLLERVGLAGSEQKMPSELSGGMQKRVGLARALYGDPSHILYDDPTAGLDPILSDSIAALIQDTNRMSGATAVVSTHDLAVAEKIADYVLLIHNGRFVFSGTGGEFFSGAEPHARQFIDGDADGPIGIL